MFTNIEKKKESVKVKYYRTIGIAYPSFSMHRPEETSMISRYIGLD